MSMITQNSKPSYRTVSNTKRRQQIAMRRFILGIGQGSDVARYLGCDLQQARIWLESRFIEGMSWDNYGSVWVIDHIVPVRLFNLFSQDDLKIAWHHKNLSPMLKEDNLHKEGDLRFSLMLLNEMQECEVVMRLKEIAKSEVEVLNKYLKTA